MTRTAFHTGFLGDHAAADAVRIILDYGYDLAELNAEVLPWAAPHVAPDTPEATRRDLRGVGSISAISAHHPDFGHRARERSDAAVAWTEALIDLAADLDGPLVHVIVAEDATMDSIERALESTLRAAQRRSIVLALEPVVNRPVGTKATALEILARVPDLTINFDPSHLQVMDGEVVEAADALGPRVTHVHIKDAAGTPEKFEFVKLGTGTVDFVGMLARLARHATPRAISIEHESHYFSTDHRPRDQVMRESRSFLDELIRGAARAQA